MPNSNYTVGDPKGEQLIQELVDFCDNPVASDLIREILTTVVKMGREHEDRGDFKLTSTTLKELRHSFRVFLPYRETRKVVIFGSARTEATNGNYRMAQSLAKKLVERGHMIITGAGGGIMEAANLGAGRDNSFGINIKLPKEQTANLHIAGDSKLMQFKYFFTRKLMFIKESDATVLFPGGFGTQDEGFENLTLFQTGKCMPRPILLAEEKGGTYWDHWLGYIKKELLGGHYITPTDLHLFHRVHSIAEAVDFIGEYYRYFHSLRYIGDQTVLRFTREIPPAIIKQLNQEFNDVLQSGEFQVSGPLETEIKNNEFPHLPRLIFKFDKHHFGNLHRMILWINRNL